MLSSSSSSVGLSGPGLTGLGPVLDGLAIAEARKMKCPLNFGFPKCFSCPNFGESYLW